MRVLINLIYDRTTFSAGQMLVDFFALVILSMIALALSLSMSAGVYNFHYVNFGLYAMATVASASAMIFCFAGAGAYNVFSNCNTIVVLRATISRIALIMLILTGCIFVLKISDQFSRVWLVSWSIMSVFALCGCRLLAALAAQGLIRKGKLTRNIAIVGSNDVAHRLAAKVSQEGSGTHLVGLFDPCPPEREEFPPRYSLSTLDGLLVRGCVDEVMIAMSPSKSDQVLDIARRYYPFPVALRVLAPQGYEHFQILDSCRYGNIGTFGVMAKPLDEGAAVVKWLEDKFIALVLLLLALPLVLLIALSIKLDSRGPVFFKQKRLGANNRAFDLYKFRSMFADQTDPLGVQLTRPGDPRVTRVGRFLRATSLDELPQLINVLRGDMSLVGPRPHPLAASADGVPYAGAVIEYPMRHRVKPGMTGWAQVNGWRGETKTIEQIKRRVEHDLYYVENWSLTFDLVILGRTVFAVLSRTNAV